MRQRDARPRLTSSADNRVFERGRIRTNARALALGVRIALAALLAADAARAADPAWIARGREGMVAADHPEASRIGAEVLKAGGNAFDAAFATSLALTVCRPESTGIGGGGFLVAYVARERRFVALDFREMAPAAATPERYAKLNEARGDGPSASIYGGNAVGVPGLVAGLGEIHKRFATRDWAELVRPAAELARRGFEVDKTCREACVEALADIERYRGFRERFAGLARRIAPDGKVREVGARFERPDIADTLRLIAERGPAAFYGEPIGSAIVRAVNEAGGAISSEDLSGYRVKHRDPIRGTYTWQQHQFEIVTMPLPSSGGLSLRHAFGVLDHLPETRCGLYTLPDYEIFLVESLKHVFANRARWLGDPEFSQCPDQLLRPSYASELWKAILRDRGPNPIESYGWQPGIRASTAPDDGGTSHFCVADRFGNIVSMTETINGVYGSFVVVEPFGIILNNQMDDFTTVEGKSNLFGLVQGKANLVAPGKRPLSSMSPTIVMRDGKLVLAIGASGGPRIITAVLQVALRAMNGISLGDAMDGLRLHHQWKPDEIYLDREPNEQWIAILGQLKSMGYKISDKRRRASVQAIQFLPDGEMVGASDPNKGGRPAGF